MHSAAYAIALCPSARVMFIYCIETRKHYAQTFFHHLDIVVIPYQTKYSEGDHPNGDVEMQARYVKRHFRLISLSRK